jgi:dienelactone hydrolase
MPRFMHWKAGDTPFYPALFRDIVHPQAQSRSKTRTGPDGYWPDRVKCVSAEFRAFGAGGSSPVTRWLRALANLAHSECGGPGVGAIGMCFSGNFALSMMLESSMLAPVLSQPALLLDDLRSGNCPR